jgi:hypothetical protein
MTSQVLGSTHQSIKYGPFRGRRFYAPGHQCSRQVYLLDWLVSVLETVPVTLYSKYKRWEKQIYVVFICQNSAAGGRYGPCSVHMPEQCSRWALWSPNIRCAVSWVEGTWKLGLRWRINNDGHSWDCTVDLIFNTSFLPKSTVPPIAHRAIKIT